jgi:hypothetical protein
MNREIFAERLLRRNILGASLETVIQLDFMPYKTKLLALQTKLHWQAIQAASVRVRLVEW